MQDLLVSDERPSHRAPPLWSEYRDDPPKAAITSGIVYVDGRKAGQLDQPHQVAGVDALRELFAAALLDGQAHRVRIDWRSAELGQVVGQTRMQLAPAGEPDGPPAGPAARGPALNVDRLLTRLLDQNQALMERTHAAVLDQATAQRDAHERIMQMFVASQQRAEQAHEQYLARQEANREVHLRELQSSQAAGAAERERADRFALQVAATGGAPPPTGGLMGTLGPIIEQKLAELVSGKLEAVLAGDTGGGGPLEAAMGRLIEMIGSSRAPAAAPAPKKK